MFDNPDKKITCRHLQEGKSACSDHSSASRLLVGLILHQNDDGDDHGDGDGDNGDDVGDDVEEPSEKLFGKLVVGISTRQIFPRNWNKIFPRRWKENIS